MSLSPTPVKYNKEAPKSNSKHILVFHNAPYLP